MCVYSSLPLEGELGLLLDSRTLGGKLVQQDGLLMARAGQPCSSVYCLPLSSCGPESGSLCPCITPPWRQKEVLRAADILYSGSSLLLN